MSDTYKEIEIIKDFSRYFRECCEKDHVPSKDELLKVSEMLDKLHDSIIIKINAPKIPEIIPETLKINPYTKHVQPTSINPYMAQESSARKGDFIDRWDSLPKLYRWIILIGIVLVIYYIKTRGG